jgi:hypothetical protein
MVAILGHAFGQETIPIALLADFDTTILSPVKILCRPLDEQTIERKTYDQILCESVNTLDQELNKFAENLMQKMNMGKLETKEGHSVSQ